MPSFSAWRVPRTTAGWPLMRISPASAAWIPVRIFISVDLPAPFSPISA